MRKMNERTTVLVFAALTAIGFALRRLQLAIGYDADGLPLPGAGVLLGVYSAAVAVLVFLYCRKLKGRAGFQEAFSFSVPAAVASGVGAGLILIGSAIAFFASGAGFSLEKAAALLGAVAVLSIAAQQNALYKNEPLQPMIGMLPIIFYLIRLIGDFKAWSTDPIILDYWVKLFAMLSILLAAYYLGGFGLGKGKRDLAACFCVLAVVFSVLCLADGGAEFSLIAGGSMLWEGACGWQLLRPDAAPAADAAPEA